MKKSMLRFGTGVLLMVAAILAGTLLVPFSAQAGSPAPDVPAPAIFKR